MTISEENYIKVIYHLSLVSPKGVNTNAIAGMLETKASSVTDMLKKLSEKDLVMVFNLLCFINPIKLNINDGKNITKTNNTKLILMTEEDIDIPEIHINI
jgi:hypothetical protein